MKIRIDNFKGEIPRLAKTKLPAGYATLAENVRLRSGDLEPIKEPLEEFDFEVDVADVHTMRLENGDKIRLRWTTDQAPAGVSVATGFNAGPERAYFTGVRGDPVGPDFKAWPKVTDADLASSGTPAPAGSLRLGVPRPTPDGPLIAEEEVTDIPLVDLPGASYENGEIGDFTRIFRDGDGWNGSQSALEDGNTVFRVHAIRNMRYMQDTGIVGGARVITDPDREYPTRRPVVLRNNTTPVGAGIRSVISFRVNLLDDDAHLNGNFGIRILCDEDGAGTDVSFYFLTLDEPVLIGEQEIRVRDVSDWGQAPIKQGELVPIVNPFIAIFQNPDDLPAGRRVSIPPSGGFTGPGTDQWLDIQLTINSDDMEDAGFRKVDGVIKTHDEIPIATFSRRVRFRGTAWALYACRDDYIGRNKRSWYYFDSVRVSNFGDGTAAGSFTSYTYTYVNRFGEEGPPAPLTKVVLKDDTTEVALSGFELAIDPDIGPVSDFGIESIRLYRAVTNDLGTSFFLVPIDLPGSPKTEIPLALALAPGFSYTDRARIIDLGPPLISENFDLPPIDGQNIIALANGIMMLSSGRSVRPSESFQPHAYPLDYELNADFPIKALAAINTTAVAMTEGPTYLIVGSQPADMTMVRIPAIYGCQSRRSVAVWKDFGVIYAASVGLISVDESGARVLTERFITEQEWDSFNPASIVGFVQDDVYIGFYVQPDEEMPNGFIFDPREGGSGFTRLRIRIEGASPTAGELDALTGELSLVFGQKLFMYGEGEINLPYRWRSQVFQLAHPTGFSAAQVRGRGPNLKPLVEFKLFRDDEVAPYFPPAGRPDIGDVTSDREFRINDISAREVVIELASTDARINVVEIAEDMDELE